MSIARQYVDILSRRYITIRTRNVVAPVDAENDLSPPVLPAEPLPKTLSVTEKKRGRPATGNALTAAEKQRRYRERKRAADGV